jgi:transcriptional antiterminator NusG
MSTEVEPQFTSVIEEDASELAPTSAESSDDTAEEVVAAAPDLAEKAESEEERPEQAVEEVAPILEAEASEVAEAVIETATVEAETTAEGAEGGEEQSGQLVEEATPTQEVEASEVSAAVVEAETAEAEVITEEAEDDVPEPQDDRAWYVVHCYSGYENKVKHNLEQRIETMQMQSQIFQIVVPTEDEMEVRDGKRRIIERRVFPGYLLVQMLLTDDSWYVVRNTPGVTGFVGMGNEPTPLRPEEVQSIMRRMEAEAPKIKVTFKSGQKVRIIDGPFNEFIGVVDEIDMERAKVRVLVSFFGRETPVELDFLQVEKT